MSAHTNGPLRLTADAGDWRATHDGLGFSEYRAIVDAAGKVVALVVDHDREDAANLDTEGNGLLFAAAPELLEMAEALQAVCARIIEQYGCVQCGIDFHALGSAVNRVLAKATGAAS